MKKVLLISLGCAKNLVDSERILGILKNDDYVIVNNLKNVTLSSSIRVDLSNRVKENH